MSATRDRAPDTEPVVPAEGFQYYRGRYWNDLDRVVRTLNERATGDPELTWMEHLRDNYGPFRHALVLNCGNGWVERDLVAKGVVASAVGVDVSDELLDQARREAAAADLPLTYVQLDTNVADFPDEDFDLVVNHAAMHHVAYIDRVTRRICQLLAPDGVFVSWDYVGPHRNQYTAVQWEHAWTANLGLAPELRQEMRYPHMPTMLVGDPTEAVHSELIVPTIQRYFRIEHHARLGGGVAYLLLTHNDAIQGRSQDDVDDAVQAVMTADAALTDAAPDTTLFAYIVARADPASLADTEVLSTWTAAEDDRERLANTSGGRYYPPTAIGAVAEALVVAEDAIVNAGPADRDAVIATTSGRTLARVLVARVHAGSAHVSEDVDEQVGAVDAVLDRDRAVGTELDHHHVRHRLTGVEVHVRRRRRTGAGRPDREEPETVAVGRSDVQDHRRRVVRHAGLTADRDHLLSSPFIGRCGALRPDLESTRRTGSMASTWPPVGPKKPITSTIRSTDVSAALREIRPSAPI